MKKKSNKKSSHIHTHENDPISRAVFPVLHTYKNAGFVLNGNIKVTLAQYVVVLNREKCLPISRFTPYLRQ